MELMAMITKGLAGKRVSRLAIEMLTNAMEAVKLGIAYVLYYAKLSENSHVHMQDGNDKLGKGIHNVSLLPGDEPLTKKDGTVLTNIKGTCGTDYGAEESACEGCKGDCYAVNSGVYHYNSCIPAWAENTLLAVYRPKQYWAEVIGYAIKVSAKANFVAVRLHVSGEIPNWDYFVRMCETVSKYPKIKFYIYTKRFSFVERWLKENGKLPDNLAVLVSIWHKNYANPYGLAEFIYDDGTEPELEKVFHCPAVSKDGKETGIKCNQCKRCPNAKPGMKTAVYAH